MRRHLLPVLLVPILLAGCGSAAENLAEEVAERAAEAGGGGDVEIDVDDDGRVTVDSDEGSFSAGAGSSLPDGFPDDMPLPEGLEPIGAFGQETDGAATFGVQFVGVGDRDAQADLVAFYERELEASGWTIESTSTSDTPGAVGTVLEVADGEYTGQVVISLLGPDEDEPQLTVAINLQSAE